MYRLRLQVSCPWRRLRPPPVPTGHGERSEGETLKLLTDCEGGAGAGAGDGPGAGAKKEDKKAISTQAVCIPPGSPSEARLVLMDGWMDGRAGKVEKNHVFSKYLKNFAIFFRSCFASP